MPPVQTLFLLFLLLQILAVRAFQTLTSPLCRFSPLARYFFAALSKHAFAAISGMLAVSRGMKLYVSADLGEEKSLKDLMGHPAVWIANHQAELDWLQYIWLFASSESLLSGFQVVVGSHFLTKKLLGPFLDGLNFTFVGKDTPLSSIRYLESAKISKSINLPYSILIFPEGAFVEPKTREKSQAYATAFGIVDLRHSILPRTTGLFKILLDLHSVFGPSLRIIDFTLGYPDVPTSSYPYLYHSFKSFYFERKVKAEASLHLRSFTISEALGMEEEGKTEDEKRKYFDEWLLGRWREKDEILAVYKERGSFGNKVEVRQMRPSLQDLVALAAIWVSLWGTVKVVSWGISQVLL